MTEIEKYLFAAKAAGIKIFLGPVSSDVYDRDTFYISEDVFFFGVCKSWNPLIDKANSFALMIAASITYDAQHGWASARLSSGEYVNIPINDDPLKAIFECAVAIGKSMEESNVKSSS